MRDVVLDEVCEDDPDYADGCPAYAAVDNYCKDQEDFMRKNCPKSCGFCEKESIKPPAPATVCEDDPDYADACPEYAAVEGYCKYHEEFMKENCPKSCGLCEKESTKPPAPAAVCEDDPNYADGCPAYAAVENYCTDQEEFMKKNCPKSCGLCEKATVTPAVSSATAQPAAVSTESAKSPAPSECKDDPEHEITCKDIAATAGLCEEQKQFTQEHCALSCKWCESIKPPAPAAVCEDDPDYADDCPAYAAVEGYCTEHEEFMKKNCPKSCGLCQKATVTPAVSNATFTPAVSNATVQPAAVSTESVKPPAPAAVTECEDDPEHEITCKDIAATAGLCEEQKQFTQEHCALSCEWCESPTTKAPIQEICGEDLPKWAARCPEWAKRGECDNPRVQVFLWHYCRKSCKLPCKTEPPTSGTKPPSPPAFCRDRDRNCPHWKSLGLCGNPDMPIYCGVTCDICKEPTPDQCFDKKDNCKDMKNEGDCTSSAPEIEYEVKTNCLKTCEFCVPDVP